MPDFHRLSPILACAAFAAAGCAGTSQRTATDYDPGGTPHAQFLKAASLCEKQAESDEKTMGLGAMDITHGTYNRMFDACMRASGFTQKPPQ
jgi:threonine dehydrogenase-like Zn-dependent dehydrogenase